jgi:hypothetical protein
VTTLAAGLVPIRTTLTTQDGTVIGQGADVVVRVTPTAAEPTTTAQGAR